MSMNFNPRIGSTGLLNKLFGKDFTGQHKTVINNGTVEIQYDYNCSVTEFFVVADAHGYLSQKEIELLIPLFDNFIIYAHDKDK